tara:strand:- start:6387 stop:7463 length:1077 start_codon:yes stop_codon:yes gene_type:complete
MREYLDLLQRIIDDGYWTENRTGVRCKGVWGHTMRFNLEEGFPIVTTKKINFQAIVTELIFFIKGYTDKRWLQDRKCNIWNEWANPKVVDEVYKTLTNAYNNDCIDKDKASPPDKKTLQKSVHDLGPVYGWQWRHFGADYEMLSSLKAEMEALQERWKKACKEEHDFKPWENPSFDHSCVLPSTTIQSEIDQKEKQIEAYGGFDQLLWVQDQLMNNPDSRQTIMSAWNPNDLDKMALPPCHLMCHFRVFDGKLSTLMLQRSCDSFLGVPFNISSYALLTHLMAKACGLGVGEFVHVLDDVHIYENHIDQIKEQLTRKPKSLPQLSLISESRNIEDFEIDDISLPNYVCHPAIKATVAV